MRHLKLILSAFFVWGLSSSPAIAQPTLSAPVDLSTLTADASEIRVAISTDGTKATAVWRETLPSGTWVAKTSSATIAGGGRHMGGYDDPLPIGL